MSDLAAWFLSIGSFAAVVLLTAFAAKALAGDPPRGRRRCPRCWHELGPLPAERAGDEDAARRARTCGECGHEARSERDTVRTRRQPVRAALAVLAVVAIVLALRMRVVDRGFWSMMPTSVLIVVSDLVGEGGFRSPQAELSERIWLKTLDDAQLVAVLDRAVRAAQAPAGADDAWQRKYGSIVENLRAAIPANSPDAEKFLEIPPFAIIDFLGARRGRPQLMTLEAVTMWPRGVEGKVAIEYPDGSSTRARLNPDSFTNSLVTEIPESLAADAPIRVRISVRPRGSMPDAPWRDYPAVTTRVPASVAGVADDPDARPVDSERVRAAVIDMVSQERGLSVWSDGVPRAGLRLNVGPVEGAALYDTLIGLRVEICEQGVVRRTSRIWCFGGTRDGRSITRLGWLPPIEDVEALGRLYAQDPALDSNWTIRITGDAALADYARPSPTQFPARDGFLRWEGTIELPLTVTRIATPSPERRWLLERSGR